MSVVNTSSVPESAPAPQVAGDLGLAAAVLRRDRKATAEFVERFSDPIYAYLRSRLTPRDDLVEDYLQEVFLAAWKVLDRYQGQSPLRGWLIGIARHKVEDHYRSALKTPFQLDEDEDPGPSVEPGADERIDEQRMHKQTREVLERLPERYRVALLWRYWEGCPAATMAERTGKSVKAIERLLARARQAFRKEWTGE